MRYNYVKYMISRSKIFASVQKLSAAVFCIFPELKRKKPFRLIFLNSGLMELSRSETLDDLLTFFFYRYG
jgi:hypothetical protein